MNGGKFPDLPEVRNGHDANKTGKDSSNDLNRKEQSRKPNDIDIRQQHYANLQYRNNQVKQGIYVQSLYPAQSSGEYGEEREWNQCKTINFQSSDNLRGLIWSPRAKHPHRGDEQNG